MPPLRKSLSSGFINPKIMKIFANNWFKYVVGLIACLSVRLIPFRPPNIEPILAIQMPFSRNYGKTVSFSFAFLSIILYDIITTEVGVWTFITALSYGLLGVWANVYFKNKENKVVDYVKFAIFGTIAYDIVTGLSIGPLFFNQSFVSALIGQIPFTLMHLLGNISFAILLSPAIGSLINQNKKTETLNILKIFNPKQA
jgi:uncharacterized membrane protein